MIYIELKNALTPLIEEIPGIGTFTFYAEQYIRLDEEDPVSCPGIYLEIPDVVKWNEAGNKVQHSRMKLRFHVVTIDAVSPEDPMVFAQLLMEKLNGKPLYTQVLDESDEVVQQDNLCTRLLRTGTSFPKPIGDFSVMLIDFEAEVSDLSFVDVLTETEEAITYTITVD